jgi:hypothetical protein
MAGCSTRENVVLMLDDASIHPHLHTFLISNKRKAKP